MSATDPVSRLTAWRHAAQAAVCDHLAPWDHGTIVRSSRFPAYWDLNVLRVEDDAELGVEALMSAAEEGLRGLAHRRVDFDLADAGLRLRSAFADRGWKSLVLVWMRHEAPLPPVVRELAVEPVGYDAVEHLRRAWHEEDFPGINPSGYQDQAREVALGRGAEVLAVSEAGRPIGFAQLERAHGSAEIGQVYVHPQHRGHGLGTSLTRAAITRLSEARDLWICADDEDRPKGLYARLGFRPVARTIEFLRLPGSSGESATSRSELS